MANYYATARSNYFGVKDRQAFKDWADSRNLEWWSQAHLPQDEEDDDTLFAICPSQDDDCGCWPWYDLLRY